MEALDMEIQGLEKNVRLALLAFFKVDGFVELRSFLLFLKNRFSLNILDETLIGVVMRIARRTFPGIQYCYVHNRYGGSLYLFLHDRTYILEEVRRHKCFPAPPL